MRVTDFQNVEFDWDENKRRSNLEKHGIDFVEAMVALNEPHLEIDVIKNGEFRVLAICQQTMRIIAIVYVIRSEKYRIISARVASRNERRKYSDYVDARRH
jgi:uncharacterized protein